MIYFIELSGEYLDEEEIINKLEQGELFLENYIIEVEECKYQFDLYDALYDDIYARTNIDLDEGLPKFKKLEPIQKLIDQYIFESNLVEYVATSKRYKIKEVYESSI